MIWKIDLWNYREQVALFAPHWLLYCTVWNDMISLQLSIGCCVRHCPLHDCMYFLKLREVATLSGTLCDTHFGLISNAGNSRSSLITMTDISQRLTPES